MFTNEQELFSGAIALKLLGQYKGTPIYKHVEGIFNNFYKVITDSKIKDKSWIEKRVVFIEEATPEFSDDIWAILIKAIIENRYVTFSYRGPYMDHIREGYHIAPYQLICKAGVWYFTGYSDRQDSVCLYALHRIISIDITDDHFEMDNDFKYYASTDKIFGVYGFEDEIKCSVQFFNETVTYITERQWAHDQEIKYLEDGSIIMTFSTGQIYEIVKFILSQGTNALPLEPSELVQAWKKQVEAMSRNTNL